MTDHDDLADLKAAMAAATPKPDAARRAAHLAQASDVFVARQGATDAPESKGFWASFGPSRFGKAWAGLATGATAVIAVAILILPERPAPLPPAPAPVMEADRSAVSALSAPAESTEARGAAPMMENSFATDAIAPQAEAADSPPEIAESRSLLRPDAWAEIAAALEKGRLPAPQEVEPEGLRNALARTTAARASALYPVPWDAGTAFFDSGDPTSEERFQLVPSDGRALSEPDDAIRFVIATAGFASLLAGENLGDWSYGDVVEMAGNSAVRPDQIRIRALMHLAADITGN